MYMYTCVCAHVKSFQVRLNHLKFSEPWVATPAPEKARWMHTTPDQQAREDDVAPISRPQNDKNMIP